MSGIKVKFAPPTPSGRLYPRYDAESGILAVESQVERPWPYGIDVDGTLICDLDEHRVLANFDVHARADRWSENADVRWPTRARQGDLVFTESTVRKKSFDSPVDVLTDPEHRLVEIRIGNSDAQEAHALSKACVAFTRGDELVGFIIDLFRARTDADGP